MRKGANPQPKHKDLVERAVRWLQNSRGCTVAFAEFVTSAWETPDAIGFQWASVLVECKVSRSDFFADRHKPFRRMPNLGMGAERYFMVPAGLVRPDEVPPKWGLLEVKGKHVRVTRKSEGFPQRNRDCEIRFLISMLRRVQLEMNRPLNEWLKSAKDAEVIATKEGR